MGVGGGEGVRRAFFLCSLVFFGLGGMGGVERGVVGVYTLALRRS